MRGARAVGDQLADGDVHARKLGSPPRQHALPRDLREDRRGRVRPPPLSGLLRGRRLRSDGVADGDDPWLRLGRRRACAAARRERRHLGRARGVPRPLPPCADQDARARVLRADPGLGLPRRLVPVPAPRSARALVTASAEGNGVAFFAHVGGFVCGWVVARALLDAGRIRPQSVSRPFVPILR